VLLGITAVFVRRIRPRCSVTDLWLVGLLWLALTVAFEFVLPLRRREALGSPAGRLQRVQGRIWVLVPMTELFGPPLIGWLMRHHPDHQASNGSG
jgi:hypothetical protein